MSTISKIKEIVRAYAAMINPTERQKMVAELRLRTCCGNPETGIAKCEFWDETMGVQTCSICKCALKAKVFSDLASACPQGKWKI